jgi:anti-anti-sigma factor
MDPQTFGFKLSRRSLPDGEEVADLDGELDILTADLAVRFVRTIIDDHTGPVAVNLADVSFCDAHGLRALIRMANYAEAADRPFRVLSPPPLLTRLMRITGLDRRFPARGAASQSGLPALGLPAPR